MQNPLHNRLRIFSPILLGGALIVSLLVTKPLYESYLVVRAEGIELAREKSEKSGKLSTLYDIKKSFDLTGSGNTDFAKRIEKLDKTWNSADIMSAVMLNEYTLSNRLTPPRISIGSITVSEGARLPSGISLGSVSVSVSAQNIDELVNYITYLTTNSPYAFVIEEISLPIDTGSDTGTNNSESAGISLGLALGLYYYK